MTSHTVVYFDVYQERLDEPATGADRATMANRFDDWKEADLQRLIDEGVHERAGYDYKESDSLRPFPPGKPWDKVIADVSKDVSAFANADGGTIIYGMDEKDLVPTRIDGGFGSRDRANAEWLENIILSNIKPPPEELLVKPIPLADGNNALLANVGRTLRGCQANDGRYYRRRNFRNEILEDWEIRELMNRAVDPVFEFEVGFRKMQRSTPEQHTYALTASLANVGGVRIHDYRVEVQMPEIYARTGPFSEYKFFGDQRVGIVLPSRGLLGPDQEYPAKTWSATFDEPLFPGQTSKVLDADAVVPLRYLVDDNSHREATSNEYAVSWTVFADDLPPLRGRRLMRELMSF